MSCSLVNELHRRLDVDTPDSVAQILASLPSLLAQKASTLLKERRYMDYLSMTIDPSMYEDLDTFRLDYLSVEIMSKYDSFAVPIDREKAAFEKFEAAERKCKLTNQRFRERNLLPQRYVSELFAARRKISSLLGPFRPGELLSQCEFGKGATFSLKRSEAGLHNKLSGIPEATYKFSGIGRLLIEQYPLWAKSLKHETGAVRIEVVPGNRLQTVAKNSKTDRFIAIEPRLNMFYQRGIGKMIKARLKGVGINLDSQASNQRLAREGSLYRDLCTIDLASASDTVATELVRFLLPPDWYDALEIARCAYGQYRGEWIRYEKFSSMGNGYTFELETLLFWALTKVTVDLYGESERRIGVYGDDIICPINCLDPLSSLLEYCGFELNRKKSHSRGAFRESCGTHYFAGHDVTCIYIRAPLTSVPEVLLAANNVCRLASRYGLPRCRDGRLLPTWERLVCLLPKSWRQCCIPDDFGDGALVGDFSDSTPKRALKYQYLERGKRLASSQWEGWTPRFYFVEKPSTREVTTAPDYTAVMYYRRAESSHSHSMSRTFGFDESLPCEIPLHRKVKRYQIIRSGLVTCWTELGPWI